MINMLICAASKGETLELMLS